MKTIFIMLNLALSLSAQAADHPSVHGMLVFGKTNTIYVSHLPMFHNPHDYQLIAELIVPESAKSAYKQSLADHPEETVYTLVPESFVLPEMVAHPHPFKADLVRGHFERGGTEFVTQVTVKLGKIVHFRKFEPKALKPAQATYLFFGSKEEGFLAHFITAKPDFDQLIEVEGSAPEEAVVVENESSNQKPLSMGLHSFTKKSDRLKLDLKLEQSLYTEFGDLSH